MIQIRDLSVQYGDIPVLQEINLEVETKECILITGPSGCGKSTLAYAISGLIPHVIPAQMQGSVHVAGMDTRQNSLPQLARQVGMVFQNPGSQLFHLHVEDEVAFGLRNLGVEESEVWDRVGWALEQTDLEALRGRKPAELSGGQKQCLAIASVLAMQPEVMVLDEPTASLDVPSTRLVMKALQNLREKCGVTILMIEHRLAESTLLADRVLLMDRGRIVADGLPAEIFSDRETRLRLGLRRPTDQPKESWDDLIQINGRSRNGQTPLLEMRGVTAGYNRQPVIQDIDLAIYPGDFTALVGDNGAGKSTLALVAAGLLKPQQGQVRYLNGQRPRPGADVALLFQNPVEQLFCDSIDEEVAFGPRNYDCFDRQSHLQTLEKTDLAGLRERRPTLVSAGQQQRTTLAACLALRPKLVILDEPTLGQDWGHLQSIMDYLSSLNQQGAAILLISHDYKLVHHYARQAVLMENGRIKSSGYLPHTIGIAEGRIVKEKSYEILDA
jgi:energy-coupling factor transport system ATP-binding protein